MGYSPWGTKELDMSEGLTRSGCSGAGLALCWAFPEASQHPLWGRALGRYLVQCF